MRLVEPLNQSMPIAFGAPLTLEEAHYIRTKQFKALQKNVANFENHIEMIDNLLSKRPYTFSEKQLVSISCNYVKHWLSVYGNEFYFTRKKQELNEKMYENIASASKGVFPKLPKTNV